MLDNISVFHSSIRIVGEKTIYFDPYKIEEEYHDADIIFITHSHFDHYSPNDIDKVMKEDTIIVVPSSMKKEIDYENVCFVEPDSSYTQKGLEFKAIRAYNIGKPFHPKSNNWLGYLVKMDNMWYYVAGDTDNTPDAQNIKCDIALLPCGGMYTMNAVEASDLANHLKPKYAIPTHYGSVAGSKEDGDKFVKLLSSDITGVVKIK